MNIRASLKQAFALHLETKNAMPIAIVLAMIRQNNGRLLPEEATGS
ncbi:MAG: hypothetical protein R3E31_14290 [Chloroflexota bacterium]